MPTFLPVFTMKHFAIWGLSILAPYVLLIGGFIILKTHRGQKTFEKVFDVGYDSCILGIGIATALLGGSEFQAILETNAAWVPLLLGFFIIVMLYVLETLTIKEVTRARWSVFAGTFIFGANTAVVTWLNERRVGPTLFCGIISFVVPCTICYVIISKLKTKTSTV